MAFIVAIDFDGTLFEDLFPKIGAPKMDVISKLKECKENGAEIVLWTCREGDILKKAVDACREQGIEFDAINENSPSIIEWQKANGKANCRKIHASIYVDDKARGSVEFFLKIDAEKTCENFRAKYHP